MKSTLLHIHRSIIISDNKDYARGLSVTTWSNPNDLLPKDWYISETAKEEKEKTDCEKSTPNGPCPNLTSKDVTLSQESTTFKNLPAYKTLMFGFDHSDECWLITKFSNFYQICYDKSDPNDPKLEEHLLIYEQMLQSFELLL